jgi:hypothetical protein
MANAVPRGEQYGQRSQLASNAATDRTTAGSLGTSNMAASRAASSGVDRNTGSVSAPNRQSTQENFNRGGDRGYTTPSASTRSADTQSLSDRSSSSRVQDANAGGAFGGGGSGRQERVASSRGRASMGAGGSGGRKR